MVDGEVAREILYGKIPLQEYAALSRKVFSLYRIHRRTPRSHHTNVFLFLLSLADVSTPRLRLMTSNDDVRQWEQLGGIRARCELTVPETGFLKLLLGRPELPRLSLPRRLSHLPRNSNFQCPQSWMPSLNFGMICKFLSYACIFH